MIQVTVFGVTVVLMLVVAGTFAFVAFNAGREVLDYPPLQKKSYSLRAKFFWTLLLAGVLITVLTTLDLPYAATRGHLPEDAVEIDVLGRQWFWEVDNTELKAGDTVVFKVSAADVNHGIGIYDPKLRMLGQTQAMPGYTNALTVKLDQPGNYKLLCMEYCGLAHHAMVSEITVSE